MKRLFFLAALSASALCGHAQTPANGGPTPQAPDPTAVPLDGGATPLLAGGVAYGLWPVPAPPSSIRLPA